MAGRKRGSLKSRIFFGVILCTFVPLFLAVRVSWTNMNQKITRQQIGIYEENATYIAKLCESVLEDIRDTVLLIYNDNKIMDGLRQGGNISVANLQLLDRRASSMFFSDTDIESIAFYIEGAETLIYRKRNESNRFFSTSAENAIQKYFLNAYDPEELSFSISTVKSRSGEKYYLVYNQNIVNEYNKLLMRMEIVYNQSVFDPVFDSGVGNGQSHDFILDESGNFVYEKFGEYPDEAFKKRLTVAPDGISGMEDGDSYVVIKTSLERFGFVSVKCISMEKIQEYIQPYQNGLNIIMVFVMGVTAFLAVFLSQMVSHSIQRFSQVIAEFRRTGTSPNIDFQPEIKEMDELAEQFSSMMKEINILIEEKSEARYREKKAYLKMLTVQINPHFLNNALQTLQFMAVKRKDFEISAMLASLGKILRYSLEWGKREVTLQEEWDNLMEYLNIQKFRYVDDLVLEIDGGDEIPQCRIPKMILQPLAENCFVHGFREKKDGDYRLRISIESAGGDIIIWIWDNGKGMEPGLMEKFNRELESTEPFEITEHTGILSINYRLRQKYSGAKLQLIQKGWFGVSVIIPEDCYENSDY